MTGGSGPLSLIHILLFYPILPEQEAMSWHSLEEEALPKLLHGTYTGDYQRRLMARHTAAMIQATPPEEE